MKKKFVKAGPSYPPVWGRPFANHNTFHFVVVIDMWEVDSSSKSDGGLHYCVDLYHVDTMAVSEKEIEAAFMGRDLKGKTPTEIAWALLDYGARAPLHTVATNNLKQGERECKGVSYKCDADASLLHKLLHDTPVNKIGSTAYEMMIGDISPALHRGLKKGDKAAAVMGKMYGLTDEQIKSFRSR